MDIDEWRDEPERHRYVHGGFEDTDALFSFYFPPKEQYEGRFFQYLMAISGNENAVQNPEYPNPSYSLGFAIESGAYLVESNLGRLNMFVGDDPTITAYRTSAAVAKYSRILASKMYGSHRPYGYVYGGSGGAFKTIACVENTKGVWDGSVPFIHATPIAIPNNFTVQAHAMRILKDKMPSIIDAMEPGGSGDIYAGLNIEEREALTEVTRMGFPPRAWFNYRRIAFGYTGVLTMFFDQMVKWDPTYFEDFWNKPGYLGFDPPESLLKAKVHHQTKINKLIFPEDLKEMGFNLTLSAGSKSEIKVPAGFMMEDLPEKDFQGASLILKSGEAEGCVVYIAGAFEKFVMIAFGEHHFRELAKVKAGDNVEIDNSVYLAAQTYHRHQIPTPDYYGYEQFRDDEDEPLYPQREELLCTRYSKSTVARLSGKFDGKMIVVNMLMDEIAYPWGADWYRSRIKETLGDKFDDNYRLWYIDHAMHVPPVISKFETPPVITTRIIDYGGILQQALRDLSAWVEKGIAPPESTNYKVVDAQVEVPTTAAERKGIQPIVNLTVNGGKSAKVKSGKKLKFSANVEVPPNTGSIVGIEWDFEGDGDYPSSEKLKDNEFTNLKTKTTYRFSEPGTYFPTIRVASHRHGDLNTSHARIQNIDRVRVEVTPKKKNKGKAEEKELIFEITKKPDNFKELINKFFKTIGQHTTVVQGREIKTEERGPRTEHSTRFEIVPSPGTTFYTIIFEETKSGFRVFADIEIEVSGAYKMMGKTIKKATSKLIKENVVETLHKILKEFE
ncbi:MAG: hypothetical protein GF311_24165 [Candidatus Lokiarchaeota archaeon]|nr:hypothetical protein [Candidatus Lokiarchaeota archaeon]